MKNKTPKMTKEEQLLLEIHGQASRFYANEYDRGVLKALRKEKPEDYARLKVIAGGLVKKEKLNSAINMLPKYKEQFALDAQQHWIDYNSEYVNDAIHALRTSNDPDGEDIMGNVIPNPHKNINIVDKKDIIKILETMDIVELPDPDSDCKRASECMIKVIRDSTQYNNIIADAQNRISSGKPDEKWAEEIVYLADVEPEIDPFAEQIERTFLVGGLFPNNTIGEVFGGTGNMKTFWLQHLAFCVAHGIDFEGQTVKQGRVVYIITEAYDEAILRFQALANHYDIKINRDMLRVPPEGFIDLSVKTSMAKVEATLKSYGKSEFLIIDILEKAASGFNMTSGDGWNLIYQNMVKYIRPHVHRICWVAHPAKSKDRQKEVGGSGNRLNHSDFFYRIDRRGTELKNTLHCVKNKGGAHFEPIDYYYQTDEKYKTLIPADAPAKVAKEVEVVEPALSEKDAEVLKLVNNGSDINEAIDLVYDPDGIKAKGTVRNYRSNVKKKLEEYL